METVPIKSLSVHLTDLCNSKCSFCVVASPLYVKDGVDHDGVVRFLRENAGQGFSAVNLHGGEATVHPRFLDILTLIKELGYPEVHLQTNGILLEDEAFAREVVQLGTKLFIVSLHSHDHEIHDALTHTPRGLSRTMAGIRNVKCLGARVRTNTVVTRQNHMALIDVARCAVDLGVDHLNISNFHPVGSSMFGLQRTLPRLAAIREHLAMAVDFALSKGKRVTLEGFPYCSIPEYAVLQLNNEHRSIKMLMRGVVIENYDEFMNMQMREFGPPCEQCGVRDLCGGVYPQYTQRHGWSELNPITSLSQPDAP